MKNLTKRILFTLIIALSMYSLRAQTISPYIIGNNYWYPGANTAALMAVGGKMQNAGFEYVRIGGFGANSYTNAQFIEYIDRIRAMGGEPQVQVAESKTTQQVIDMITYINVTMKRNIKYWSIGNEPEHPSGGNKTDTYVADYTKRIATALKSVDPSIKVIALETSAYKADWLAKMLDGSLDITGKDANGRYYIDIISWHNYGWNANTDAVISQMDDMVSRLKTANLGRPEAPIEWMMGEINTHWDNTLATADGKVWSFCAGQSYATLYGAAMARNAHTLAYWSIYEGKDYQGVADRGANDLSLFDKDETPRSNYWHSLMLGQNMRANYAVSSDNNADIKTVAMKDANGVSVMVMNYSKTTAYTYAAKLDLAAFSTTQTVSINVDAAINVVYTNQIPKETTHMLIFNNKGVLIKQYTYSAQDAAALVSPTIITRIPGRVEAEDYSSKNGTLKTEVTSDAGDGFDLGYTTAGDWVEYKINVVYDGAYTLDFRLASLNGNAALSLLIDNASLITNLDIASTGTSWQSWKTQSVNVMLTKGIHTLRINVIKAGFNLNWLQATFLPKNPVLAFTTPVNNASVKQGDNLTVNVTASQDQGTVSNVKLYVDNVLVRQENIAPYDWGLGTTDAVLKNLSVGPHSLRAVATSDTLEGVVKSSETIIAIQVTEAITTGLDAMNTQSRISIFPQPFTSSLTIQMVDGSMLESIAVYNVSGQLVETIQGIDADTITLGDALPAGIYTVQIIAGAKICQTKIIKQ